MKIHCKKKKQDAFLSHWYFNTKSLIKLIWLISIMGNSKLPGSEMSRDFTHQVVL